MWLIDAGPKLADPRLVGDEAARQAELARAGVAVPPLVCVPATVFDYVVAADPAIDRLVRSANGDVANRAAELRRRLSGAALPARLALALDETFGALAGPCGMVEIGACVVPPRARRAGAEEVTADPMAGRRESYLYVGREDMPRRVAQCWASGFDAEAVAYRYRRGLDPFAVRVSVLLQRMTIGVRSFVVFTRDPSDDSRRTVIAAAHGTGEGVSQEKSDIDHFCYDWVTGTVTAEIAVKRRAVGMDAARPGAGPVALTLTERQSIEPVLTDDEVRQIAVLAGRAEACFGQPQKIEGTIANNGDVVLVRTRPMVSAPATAPARHAALAGPDPRQAVWWDRDNGTESLPGVVDALTYSVVRQLYAVGCHDLCRRMGVPERTRRNNAHVFARMTGYLNGRVYHRRDSWRQVYGLIHCLRPLWPSWEQRLGWSVSDRPRPRSSLLTRVLDVAEILGRLAVHPLQVRGFLRWWDASRGRLAAAESGPPLALVDEYRALWARLDRRWGVAQVSEVLLVGATWISSRLTGRWVAGAGWGLTAGVLCAGRDNRGSRAILGVVALAERAAADPALAAELHAEDAARAWRRIVAGPHGPAFTAYLGAYGDRAERVRRRGSRTPRREAAQEPTTLLRSVRTCLDQGLRVEAIRGRARKTRIGAERTLRAGCRGIVKRRVLAACHAVTRGLLAMREDTRFCRTQLIGDCRALLLRLGEHLAAAGRIDHCEDVFDLTVDEVLGACDGALAGADLRGLAAVRAAERDRLAELDPLPARLRTPADLPLATALSDLQRVDVEATPPEPPGEVLRGFASCPGTARGPAAVTCDPASPGQAHADRVLVTGETDLDWLFLVTSAKALVVEGGTLLSPVAVTSRFLGIPTVLAVPGATRRIRDGTLVEVDGAAGTVQLLDGPS